MQSIVWQNIAAAPYASCHRCGLIRLCCMHNYWRGLESSGCVVVISIAVKCLWLISLSKSSFFWSLLLWDQCAALCLPEGHTGPFTHTVVLHVHIDDVLYFKCTSLIVYIRVHVLTPSFTTPCQPAQIYRAFILEPTACERRWSMQMS